MGKTRDGDLDRSMVSKKVASTADAMVASTVVASVASLVLQLVEKKDTVKVAQSVFSRAVRSVC